MLLVKELSIAFSRYSRGLTKHSLSPVSDISLHLAQGEIVAVIGASGSGKSLLAHALLGLLPKNARWHGTLAFQGEQLTEPRMRLLRGKKIALIPQSVTYLNPLTRVGNQVLRAARLCGQDKATARENTNRTFGRYALQPPVKALFPFQVSGGMAKRVLTASATVGNAELIIADEPTTGLDPAIAAKALDHLRQLADEGKGVLLITHDLGAAVRVAQQIVVVYAGKTVEITAAKNFHTPDKLLHPYTRALWNALPQNGFTALNGNQPTAEDHVVGCIFGNRCPIAGTACHTIHPELQRVNGSLVRCPYAPR